MGAGRAAVGEGVVPGGGVVYLRAMKALDSLKLTGDMQIGANIVKRALEEPIRQIAENAVLEGSIVTQKVKEGKDAFGYNAEEEKYEDLMDAGIIDATKVSRIALENAASITGLMLRTEATIVDKPEEEPPAPPMPPGGGGMGGMY